MSFDTRHVSFLRCGSAAALLCAATAFAGVRINGTGVVYGTIQEAVNAAASGNALNVATGIYAGQVLIENKNLMIVGGYDTNCALKISDGGTIITGVSDAVSVVYCRNMVVTLRDIGITGGRTNCGAGLFVDRSARVVANHCEVFGNVAAGYGGGACVLGTLVLTNTLVRDNQADYGGGVCVQTGAVLFMYEYNTTDTTNCDIYHNWARYDGGGVYVSTNAAQREFSDADVYANTCGRCGGGVALCPGALLFASDNMTCIGNQHGYNVATNGAGVFACGATVIVSNGSRIGNNQASGDGGGVYLTNSALYVYRNSQIGRTVEGITNSALGNGGSIYMVDATLVLTGGAEVCMGRARQGAGIFARRSRIMMYGGVLGYGSGEYGNYASAGGGGLYALACTVALQNVSVANNHAGGAGGAIVADEGTVLTCARTLFTSNSALQAGVMFLAGTSRCDAVNVLALQNSDGIHLSAGARFHGLHCTIADNGANGVSDAGGASGEISLTNCIVWNHTSEQVSAGKDVQYSDVLGGYGTGLSNISAYPLFLNTNALDYRIALNSPCVNRGVALTGIVTNDYAGNPRPLLGGYDLGAYEAVPEAGSAGVLGFAMCAVRLAMKRGQRSRVKAAS